MPPTTTIFAAPLKVAAGVVVVAVVEEGVVVVAEDEVVAFEAVEAGAVALPAGKGAGVTVVEVAGGGTDTGVVDEVSGGGAGVVEVAGGATGVDQVELLINKKKKLELDEEPPAIGPVPVPTQGKVTM